VNIHVNIRHVNTDISPTVEIPSTTAEPHSVIQRTSELGASLPGPIFAPPFRADELLSEEVEVDKKPKT
jgi:hypothetical protein